MIKSSPERFNINLMEVINNPIPEDLYPNLQSVVKILQQYMQKCVKNREYIEAQKTKDKIEEAYSCIKRRNSNQVVDKMKINARKLEAKHDQERDIFLYEWEEKIRGREMKFNEQIQKKRRANQQQIARLRQQVEMAIPITHTPDDKLKYLRNQQRKLVQQRKFLEAQKIKQQIQNRQIMLEQKHKKLRQTNIKSMIDELQQRHEKAIKQKQRQRKKVLDEMIQEKNKRLKELEERQSKQIREMKWMHNEEIKLMN